MGKVTALLEDAGLIALGEPPSVELSDQASRILKRRLVEAERLAVEDLRAYYGKTDKREA